MTAHNPQTVADIVERFREADEESFAVLERAFRDDERKGVASAIEVARRRLEAERVEAARLNGLYDFQAEFGPVGTVVGLDEVGRGPLAGPLTIGAVVLPDSPRIPGLNDSKQVSPDDRQRIAAQIDDIAIARSVQHIQPDRIDACGMSACLRVAFSRAIADIDGQCPGIATVLLDGNALHIDPRERNIVKGDARCASIAAASIIAKVERDALMVAYDAEYPGYGFAGNKGYASADHQRAIARLGLSPIHRVSFCGAFLQESLF